MHINVIEVPQSLSQTVRSFPPWSLYFTSCTLTDISEGIADVCAFGIIAWLQFYISLIKPRHRLEQPGEGTRSLSWQPDIEDEK